MKQVIHEINLNVSQPNNFAYIYAMQSDYDSETIIATLYDGNKLYDIDADSAMLNGVTEKGSMICYNNITIDSDKHHISFPLTREMLCESGDTTFVLSFIDSKNNQRKSAFPFIVKTIKDAEGSLPISILTTISEYVVRAEKAAKDSEKYSLMSKSYAVGDTGTRDNENIDNSKYYYESIKKLLEDSNINFDDSANIIYYNTYSEFRTDFLDGKIKEETLVLIGENIDHLYSVTVIQADNMTWDNESGNLTQYIIDDVMTDVIFNANTGYYFPKSYFVESVNGVMVTRNSNTQITVSGNPIKNTEITLIAPTEKEGQSAPTGLENGGTKILNTTKDMEYASSSTSNTWISCDDNDTSVEEGFWYVRYKATDSKMASDATFIDIYTPPTPITNLAVTELNNDRAVLTYTKPTNEYSDKYSIVIRCASDQNFSDSGRYSSIDNGENSSIVSNVVTGETYYFKGYSIDNKGHFSIESNIVSKMTPSRNVYLYKEGDECTDITGGWSCTGSFVKNSNYISYDSTVNSSKTDYFMTNNNIRDYIVNNKCKDLVVEYDLTFEQTNSDINMNSAWLFESILGKIYIMGNEETKRATFSDTSHSCSTYKECLGYYTSSISANNKMKFTCGQNIDYGTTVTAHLKIHNIYLII